MLFDFFFTDMAQNMLQMSRVWHDAEHENIQRVQQTTILWGVSIFDSRFGVKIEFDSGQKMKKFLYIVDNIIWI